MVAVELPVARSRGVNWNALGLAGVLGGVALLAILPFLWTVHRFPIPSFDSEVVAAWCLALALLSSRLLSGADATVRWPLPAALLGLSAIAFLQQALGMLAYSQQAVRFLLYVASMLVAYVFGRRVVEAGRARELTDVFCGAVLIGGLYSVFVQWLQLFDIEFLPMWIAAVYRDGVVQTRPFGNMGQANHVATYIAMAALSTVYLAVRARRQWFVVPSLLVAASGLAMTGSRMGTAFLLVAVAALFAPTALRPGSARLRWIGVAALLFGYMVGLIAVRTVVGEVDTLARFGQNTGPLRLELWWQAWQIALQHPLLGLGVGHFPAGQYSVARASPFVVPATNCHNIVLQLAAEFGWPAALAVCAIGLTWAVRDLRARIARPELALAMGVMLLIAIHSMLEFPLWHLYFAIPAALLFALAEPERSASATLDVRNILPVAGLSILGVGFALSANYDWIAQAGAPMWLESKNVRNRVPADADLVLMVADSKLFQPEADRLMIDLNHPPDENTNGPIDRAARVLRVLPAPEVIAQYVVLLAKAGRIDEALLHARRLQVLGHDNYPALRDWILDRTRDLGPQTAPLRHALREVP